MSWRRAAVALAGLLGAGATSLAADAVAALNARHASKAPQYRFAATLPEQEAQLRDNPLLARYRAARAEHRRDRYRPRYHFSSPLGPLNDPNGLSFWAGRWHLFYQARPPEDARWHWGHAVSDDLVHWRDLPLALHPGPEEQCYSGSVLVERDRAIAMYHGRNLGNMVAVARDPLLLNWEKVTGTTVIPIEQEGRTHHFLSAEPLPYRVYDPCIFAANGVYYSLSGSVSYGGPARLPRAAQFLFRSRDLARWEFVHEFVEGDVFTRVGDDGACPYFWPIGDRHILLFFSHHSAGQYLLGDFEAGREKFVATSHGRFNFGPARAGGLHAPSAAPDGQGGVMAIFNLNSGLPARRDDGILSLPRRLTLAGRDELAVAPVAALSSLRRARTEVPSQALAANVDVPLPASGNVLELELEIDPGDARAVELDVLRSPGAEEYTRIALLREAAVTSRFQPPARTLSLVSLDTMRSSLAAGVMAREPEVAPVPRAEREPYRVRVYLDRSVVEVFVNDRQAVVRRVYPTRDDSLGLVLRAVGGTANLRRGVAWELAGIFE